MELRGPEKRELPKDDQASLGPITIDVPRDGNGKYEPIAIPKCKRKADLIISTALKLHSSGMADEETRLIMSSIYEANCSKSTISSIADAVTKDVKGFSERIIPKRLFALFPDSTCVPLRGGFGPEGGHQPGPRGGRRRHAPGHRLLDRSQGIGGVP